MHYIVKSLNYYFLSYRSVDKWLLKNNENNYDDDHAWRRILKNNENNYDDDNDGDIMMMMVMMVMMTRIASSFFYRRLDPSEYKM